MKGNDVNKPSLKQIATVTAAGKLSVAVGNAQAQDCTTFISMNLDSSSSFLEVTESTDSVTPTDVTVFTMAKEDSDTALISLAGLPDDDDLDIALFYSESLQDAIPAFGCFGSFVLSQGQIVSAFRTGVSGIPLLSESPDSLVDEIISPIGALPADDSGVSVEEVDILFNFSDALGEDSPSPDSFYLQAIAIPGDELSIEDALVSNLVRVTINRTDTPSGSGDGKGGDSDSDSDGGDTPSDGKAT